MHSALRAGTLKSDATRHRYAVSSVIKLVPVKLVDKDQQCSELNLRNSIFIEIMHIIVKSINTNISP